MGSTPESSLLIEREIQAPDDIDSQGVMMLGDSVQLVVDIQPVPGKPLRPGAPPMIMQPVETNDPMIQNLRRIRP